MRTQADSITYWLRQILFRDRGLHCPLCGKWGRILIIPKADQPPPRVAVLLCAACHRLRKANGHGPGTNVWKELRALRERPSTARRRRRRAYRKAQKDRL